MSPALRRPLTLAAAVLIALPGVALSADPPCLTTGEFSALATYALPGIITDMTHRCAARLPPNAFLPAHGEALAGRYLAASPSAWPMAKAAFLKLSAGAGPDASAMLGMMPDDALQPLVGTLATQFAGQKLPTERCDTLDMATRSLAPLPPENVGQLLAVMASIAGKRGDAAGNAASASRPGKFSICPAPAAPADTPPAPPPISTAPLAGKP